MSTAMILLKEGIPKAWSALMSARKAIKSNNKLKFDEQVLPIYQLVEAAHHDYVQGFLKVKKAISEARAPSDVIEFLTDLRQTGLSVRSKALTFVDVELNSRQLGLTMPLTGETEALIFFKSARDYFAAVTSASRLSWYSEYVRFVEITARLGSSDDCWEQGVFGNPAKEELTYIVAQVLDNIELAFRTVTHNFAMAKKALVI
jgi:hypothetical protein